ncbi:MAG: hypothetical protein HQ530_04365 [Parcubacteria group bacterium]|nr:hypothetical protein [Parcubacteria group bacterium]
MSNILTKNLPLKLLAIAAAVFLWFYVVNEGYEVGFLDTKIQIETYNLAEDLAAANELGTAKVQVRAPAQSWSKMSEESITAFVDLKGMRKGIFSKEVKVSVDDPSITILNVDPEKISVTLEELQVLSKEIEVETTGSVNEAYEIQDPVITPDKVEIKGSQSSIEKVSKIVAPVQLNGEMTEIKTQVELEARDSSNRKLTNLVIIPKTAEVTIPVRKKNEIKTVGIKANVVGDPASGYWVSQTTVSPSSVAVQGNAEVINDLPYISTQKIDISGITSTTEKQVMLDLPDEVEIVDSSQVTVKIEVETQTITKAISASPRYTGLAADLRVTLATPSAVSLQVTGPAPQLNALKDGEVTASINLSGKKAGSHNIAIASGAISLPTGISLKSVETKEVQVVIQKK